MSPARQATLPAYLFLCLLIGGSRQAVWGNALLQLLAVAILAWAALTPDPQAIGRPARRLLQIIAAAAILILLQLIPLPPELWTRLPGRDLLVSGYEMLGMPLPWLPISMAPYDTAATVLTLLPPLALLVGMLRLKAWSWTTLFAAALLGTASSIILGILQVTAGDGSWYFYDRTNLGIAVGAFANGNHFATLLLAAIPLLAAIATAQWRSAEKQQRSLTAALAVAAGTVIAIGILINQSAAVLLLGPLVAVATALLVMRWSRRRLRQGLAAVILLLGLSTAVIVFAGEQLPSWGTSASIETRTDYWSTTARAIGDHAAMGTGIGTFQQTYRRYEDPGQVSRWYVNHAHNDYLEIALEGGVAAVILLLLFLSWWVLRVLAAWASPGALEQKAASIASAAILLHSAFDFPLRTAGLAALVAACLALLAGARGAVRSAAEGDPARHATL